MELGLVECISSSIRSGAVGELLNRRLNNLTSLNEEHSYLGVDLKEDKRLRPSSYSIRNRASMTHCLVNWVVEVSVDGKDYYVIDQRVHHTQDVHFN